MDSTCVKTRQKETGEAAGVSGGTGSGQKRASVLKVEGDQGKCVCSTERYRGAWEPPQHTCHVIPNKAPRHTSAFITALTNRAEVRPRDVQGWVTKATGSSTGRNWEEPRTWRQESLPSPGEGRHPARPPSPLLRWRRALGRPQCPGDSRASHRGEPLVSSSHTRPGRM